jgi:Domain of unknown function (DUF4158)
MNKPRFTQEQLTKIARRSDEDVRITNECRSTYSKLGFAYQLCYVRFPAQSPFGPIEELATFVAVQLDVPVEHLNMQAEQR